MTPAEIQLRHWDAIVIGTGIGGATLGQSLAQAGMSVLFCEKGASHLTAPDALVGKWAETFFEGEHSNNSYTSYLKRAGRLSSPILEVTGGGSKSVLPILGEGTGGSSVLYGMVMERFFPVDFEPSVYANGASGAQTPDKWPIASGELEPYYAKAEALYNVKATLDPLRPGKESRSILPPPPYSPANGELYEYLSSQGCHPYHLPMACEYRPSCRECIGFICDKRCKGDSVNICLVPALKENSAVLADNCEVLKLQTEAARVTSFLCLWNGKLVTLRGTTIILAAGALGTPAILLRSASKKWPRGLANGSDQVGRNLMRHFLDYYIVKMRMPPREKDLIKQLAWNDLYVSDGIKLGTVQSNGNLPPVSVIAHTVKEDLTRSSRLLGLLASRMSSIIEWGVKASLRDTMVFAGIMEDFPYADNRVTLSADGQIRIEYSIHKEDRDRLALFRRKVKSVFKGYRTRLNPAAEKNSILGHACGTCRFGDLPHNSVLDRNNKAHELDNLYVVDSSFFPTSSGTNPSLTIAANALRVADLIINASYIGGRAADKVNR
ncbi:GMC family oxidoreductase [Pseudomonas sp. FP597]|uniref:GMC family oxidoreductase n=1 Tax=Pseudomonas lactucae TaxID=2813360 RepID=A0A9X1C6S7_9PSED|nr:MULTISPECIES: GMC family oxidoreductase [Pseudomonas]MBN2977122.1 GMC family oxidoreductase [Pseudomonas lactucae]MBN2988213.1 GMC family oxidoreductase [Pseudomonas lactucae]WLI08857.1 GMC family oxidoreductase [Pseudomonas sp. FP597]